MGQQVSAAEIRTFVNRSYVKPARQADVRTVTVRAGDVHTRMGLRQRLPQVCGAIGTRSFEERYRVRLIERTGPTQGAEVYFTFELL